AALAAVLAKTGATFIAPYNHADIIAGQGTAALELCADVADLDCLLAPVGGGGLLSGTALAAANALPTAAIYGAEPAGADDAQRSLRAGSIQSMDAPDTIADGLRSTLGPLTFALIRRHVRAIICVRDEQIIAAMRLLWTRMKIVVEPSAAVPLAAVLASDRFRRRRIGIILSGGNVDLDHLPW
ncbi:MAG TPA: pyridoxal-phosphate dependent enzyme, partial [Salinisphaeraceae bacterium]|nr:pyridoxal-phosphate dependent enzyme [Salinisphaeraceae bacterium]